jgi:hypothetical protein
MRILILGVNLSVLENQLLEDEELSKISPYLRRISPEAKRTHFQNSKKVIRIGTGLDGGENAQTSYPVVIRTASFPDPDIMSILNPDYESQKV